MSVTASELRAIVEKSMLDRIPAARENAQVEFARCQEMCRATASKGLTECSYNTYGLDTKEAVDFFKTLFAGTGINVTVYGPTQCGLAKAASIVTLCWT